MSRLVLDLPELGPEADLHSITDLMLAQWAELAGKVDNLLRSLAPALGDSQKVWICYDFDAKTFTLSARFAVGDKHPRPGFDSACHYVTGADLRRELERQAVSEAAAVAENVARAGCPDFGCFADGIEARPLGKVKR